MVVSALVPAFNRKFITAVIIIVCFSDSFLYPQVPEYVVFCRVHFRDKGENIASMFSPYDLLSPRAVDRRKKAGIEVPAYNDLPVWKPYTDEISSLGFTLHSTSRWMNSALFKTEGPADINILLSLPFVSGATIVKDISPKKLHHDKLAPVEEQSYPLPFNNPVAMHQGTALHNSGFNGKGILIAVLDAGFSNASQISSLNSLRNRNGIKGTYDFVKNNSHVFDYHFHGTAVVSVLAGDLPGLIAGSATGADYLLLRTEDPETEYPAEEDYWVAGAEYADSTGADIINSSLGYSWFDDPVYDYKFSDMDGNSTFITRAADIAASKGILVVNSAGNERDNEWLRIVAPADGDSVLAVGAVDGYKVISSFSSAGPSADNRIKPDVTAQGVSVPVQIATTGVTEASGTSFSCPVVSGLCACVMQAVPDATSFDIITALQAASDRSSRPDSLYGYGIPDIIQVISYLQDKYVVNQVNRSSIAPNPFTDNINIIFEENPVRLKIEIFNTAGKLILRKDFKEYISRSLRIDELQNHRQGLYIVRLTTGKGVFTHKAIKISN